MTILEEQVNRVNREVDLLQASGETHLAIQEIEAAHDDLDAGYKDLNAMLSQRCAIEDGDDAFRFDDVAEYELALVQQVSKNLEHLTAAWSEDRARIRQSGKVGKMVESVELYAKEISKNNRRKWKSWSESESSNFSVSETELESIKNVPAYNSAIVAYRSKSARFRDGIERIPMDAKEISDLAALSKELREIKSEFKFDLPKFVLDFFNELNANESVPLAGLSDELMDWLKDNDEMKNLLVSRRGMRRSW